ncbi:hypothetical protein NDA12_002788 [Ustilago hordei]|nr:hypothetical protein NDA12_002788 [Ustilago hordei]
MVCTSNKQHLLDDIETTIMHSLMVESKMQLDLVDVDATWHPNDDLEDSDDDMFNHAISFMLIRTYDIISQSRYTMHSKLSLTDSAQPMPSDQYQAFGMFSSKWQLVYIGLDSQEMVVEFMMLHLPAVAVGAQFIYTVGPYSNTAAAKSRDLHYFNYSLSCICVKAEHGIAYLKNHFQYEVAEYLKASETLSEAEVLETTSGMEAYQQATEDARIQRRENQQQYKQEQAAAMEGMSQN